MNAEENITGPAHLLGDEADQDSVHWDFYMHKEGLTVGRTMIIQKAQDIYRAVYSPKNGVTSSVGSAGQG